MDREPAVSLSARSTRGALLLFLRRGCASAIQLGAIAVLARKLDPSDFGLVALAALTLQLIQLFGTTGIDHFIMFDRAEGREDRTRAAFWMNLFLSGGVALLALGLLPAAAAFYREPRIFGLGLVLTASFLGDQIGSVPRALLRRELDYRVLVVVDTAYGLGNALLSVACALLGFGVWSLVVPPALLAPFRSAAYFYFSRWRPRMELGLAHWRRIFSYSKNVLGTTILGFLSNEGDSLVIGRFLGAGALGIYDLAWRLANLGTRNITGVVTELAMPSLSLVRAEPERFRRGAARMIRLLALVSFPFVVTLFVLAEEVVLIVYGPSWRPAILPLQILLCFALVRAVTSPTGVFYNAVGRPDLGLKWTLGFLPFYAAAILVGVQGGIVGVAAAVSAVRLVGALLRVSLTGRVISLPFSVFLEQTRAPFLTAFATGTAMYALKRLLAPLDLAPVETAALVATLGLCLYAAAVLLFLRADVRYVAHLAAPRHSIRAGSVQASR